MMIIIGSLFIGWAILLAIRWQEVRGIEAVVGWVAFSILIFVGFGSIVGKKYW